MKIKPVEVLDLGAVDEGIRALSITRRLGEGVMIGDEIRVEVVGVREKQVRLRIFAHHDVRILRDELVSTGVPEKLRFARKEEPRAK